MDSPGFLSDNGSAGGGGEKRSSGTSASGLPLSNAPSMLLGQLLRSVPAKYTSPGAKAGSQPGMCSSSAHLNTVGERIRVLKAERQEAEAAIAALEEDRRHRGAVDLVIDQLKDIFALERHRAKTLEGLLTRLAAKVAAYTVGQVLNKRLERPIRHLTSLLV